MFPFHRSLTSCWEILLAPQERIRNAQWSRLFESVPQVAEEILHPTSEHAVEQIGRAKVLVFMHVARSDVEGFDGLHNIPFVYSSTGLSCADHSHERRVTHDMCWAQCRRERSNTLSSHPRSFCSRCGHVGGRRSRALFQRA